MNKFTFKKRYIIYIILILIIPIFFISSVSFIVKFGTKYINTKEIIINLNKDIGLGDYLTYYISILGIEATSLLSYMLYRTSVKSNKLAEAINAKEDNRDDERVRESALIIYYDFASKISIIKELYTKYVLKKDIDINRSIIMQEEWVKNLANLRDILTRKELDKLFALYNRFELIGRFQKENNDKCFKNSIKNMCEDIFINLFLKYLWMDYHAENECLLNYEYYNIFKKIEEKINDEKTNQRVSLGDISDFTLFNGSEIYTDKNEKLIYKLKYLNGKIVEGEYYNYVNKVYEKVFEGEFDDKYEITSGYIIKFDKSMGIEYKGEIKNNRYDGDGTLYIRTENMKAKFIGEWRQGKKYKGEWTSNGSILHFSGEYRNDEPYSGEIECSKTKCIGNAYGFNGRIEKGEPLNGCGYIKNNIFYDDEFIEEHPECYEEDYYEQENNDDDNDMYKQLTNEERQELFEDSIRTEKENYKDYCIHQCGVAVELLKSEWKNGNCQVATDDLLNKEYIGINIK